MARIIKKIEIEGQTATALFDTGAIQTYIRSELLRESPSRAVTSPVRVGLGGKTIEVTEVCLFDGRIDGLEFFGEAIPVAELGKADGQELDAIIGAATMEKWEIRLDPKSGTLDLSGLRRREFTEF